MIEPNFGSSPSIWTAFPSSPFGYAPPQTASADVSPVNMYGYAGRAANGQAGINSALSLGPGSLGLLWGIPTLLAPEITLPSLLATVAAKRGQPQGPTNDQEIEEFIYEAGELVPGLAEVDVRCETGRVVLTGNVVSKRFKRDVGEIAWAIPGVNDVQNNVTIAARRRSRAGSRDAEPQSSPSTRKAG